MLCPLGRDHVFDAEWPIRTRPPQRKPAYVATGATFEDSPVSAEIRESLLFGDTVLRSGARVTRSIVDTGCELPRRQPTSGVDQVALDDPDAIPIVGATSRGGSCPAGGVEASHGHDGLTAGAMPRGQSPMRRRNSTHT